MVVIHLLKRVDSLIGAPVKRESDHVLDDKHLYVIGVKEPLGESPCSIERSESLFDFRGKSGH